jgi:spermidine/putrescine-binding protein
MRKSVLAATVAAVALAVASLTASNNAVAAGNGVRITNNDGYVDVDLDGIVACSVANWTVCTDDDDDDDDD